MIHHLDIMRTGKRPCPCYPDISDMIYWIIVTTAQLGPGC